MSAPILVAVPNLSEGRDRDVIEHLSRAFTVPPARLLDVHSDPDHHRSVLTLAGPPIGLSGAILAGAREAIARIDLGRHRGLHPRVGALDVAPVVFLADHDVGAACAEALVVADRLADELELPVFLYGDLAGGRTRAELRAGGIERLAERMASRDLIPDFGPSRPHPTAGAVLVAARPPLIALNAELAPPATVETARHIAAAIREGGEEGLTGVRAVGLWLDQRARAQVSMNIEDYRRTPLPQVVAAISRHAPLAEAELVGLAPRGALESLPAELPLRGRATIEDALQASH